MNLDRLIEITHPSRELDELADSFNRMRERLKDTVAELNEMTQTLGDKVAERTERLQTAQRKLMQTDRLASLGQLAASVSHINLSMLLEHLMANGGFLRAPPDTARILGVTEYWRELENALERAIVTSTQGHAG